MYVNMPSHMITSGKNGHRIFDTVTSFICYISRNADHLTLTVDSGLADPVYL